MTNALRNLAELERVLARLPPPKDGMRRVYRGQTTNYPKMLSSACRPGSARLGRIWDIALQGVHTRATAATTDATLELLMNMRVWFKVLAQHYGPGSPYLDVTSSVEVALWFALNRVRTSTTAQFAFSQPGVAPIPVTFQPLSFVPHRDGSGWFYVLDVPRWRGESSIPKHGDLIELGEGPPFVAECQRVRRQKGALVLGDPDIDGGDLSRFYACPPIAVARDFEGAPFIDSCALELFPSPEGDTWYEALLQAPLVPQPEPTHGLVFRQSLGVYVVAAQGTKEEASAVVERQFLRTLLLARLFLREEPGVRRGLRESVGLDPEAATYIQLEMPLLRFLPPPDHWNQSALAAGLARRVRPRVEGTDEMLPALSLENVLIELSPLEYGFDDLKTTAPFSAVWVVRRGERLAFVVFRTGAEGARSEVIGPFWVRFETSAGRFEVELKDGWSPLLATPVHPSFAKVFFVALDVLRGLSPAIKPDAYPTMTFGDTRVAVPIRDRSTVLTRARADKWDMRLHFLRESGSGEPYGGPRNELAVLALMVLETAEPYAQLRTLDEIYGRAVEVTERGGTLPLPPRPREGYSRLIAELLLQRYAGSVE